MSLVILHITGFQNAGYETGVERIIKLINENRFSKDEFKKNPVKGVENFLKGYFNDREGNQPEIWSENNTIFLKTPKSMPCITREAEKKVNIYHKDICHIYGRVFVKGLVKVFEEFFPGIKVNFYNAGSRRDDESSDCIEAFQVISPY